METNAAGSTYTITAMPYEEDVFDINTLCTTAIFTPQGSTLGEILTSLGQAMSNEDRILEGVGMNTWNFQLGSFIKDGKTYNPASWPLTGGQININYADLSNMGMQFTATDASSDPVSAQNKGVRAYFPKGMKVTDIVECLFLCCLDAQLVAKDVNTPNTLDKETLSFRNCFVFRHEPSVQITGFNPNNQRYIKNITFTSLPYFTNKPILTQNDVKAAASATNQQSQVAMYMNSGYLVKRYDYMFTGLNTEVLDYNIKFNLSWQALLPNIYAYTGNTSAVVDHTMARPAGQTAVAQQNTLSVQQQQAYQTAQQAIGVANEDIANQQAIIAANQATSTTGLTAAQQSAITAANAAIATDNSTIASANATSATLLGKTANATSSTTSAASSTNKLGTTTNGTAPAYAEDELKNVIQQRTPISTKQTIPDDAQGAASQQYTVDRSIYGAILGQIHSPVENELSNIALTIKGDPYWLGAGNLERLVGHAIQFSTPRNNLAAGAVSSIQTDFTYGDIMLLMSFKYSLGTNTTGTPIINQNQNFTGIYAVKQIVHTFKNGQFTQDITGLRQSLINAFQALGLQTSSTSSTTTSVTTANSQSALSQWTLNGQPGASATSSTISKLS